MLTEELIEFPYFFTSFLEAQISPLNLSAFPKVHLPENCAESLATVEPSSVIAQTALLLVWCKCCCSCTFSRFPFKLARASSYRISSWLFSCFLHSVWGCLPFFLKKLFSKKVNEKHKLQSPVTFVSWDRVIGLVWSLYVLSFLWFVVGPQVLIANGYGWLVNHLLGFVVCLLFWGFFPPCIAIYHCPCCILFILPACCIYLWIQSWCLYSLDILW